MMSRHFRLSSELTGAISKRFPHAKNQLSGPDSFFNQFVTDIYIYYTIYIYIYTYIYTHYSSFNSKDVVQILEKSFCQGCIAPMRRRPYSTHTVPGQKYLHTSLSHVVLILNGSIYED